jgi:capsular exopolysaccharide synthesis family protein
MEDRADREAAPADYAVEPVGDPAVADAEDGTARLDRLLVAISVPGSSAAEQFRLLRTRIESREQGRRAQILLVTSPRIGDGKTTTSANLALTMAQEFQQTVVLVEADLRRPTLAAQFGVQAEPGLVDVLVGAATLEDALVTVPGYHLALLPAGIAAARSTELLASTVMQRVLASLRARFSRIVIDTPPVALADTHVLARQADGVLVVVRAGVTPRPAVERALAGIDRERLMGIVLNEVDDTTDEYVYASQQLRASGE